MDHAAVNVCAHAFVWTRFHFSWGEGPRRESLGPTVAPCSHLRFLRKEVTGWDVCLRVTLVTGMA